MGTFLIAFVALTVAYSLLWHNQSPRTDNEDGPSPQKQETCRAASKPQSQVPKDTFVP